jgi:hypothetical protein
MSLVTRQSCAAAESWAGFRGENEARTWGAIANGSIGMTRLGNDPEERIAQESARADRLADKLKELGIDPESV